MEILYTTHDIARLLQVDPSTVSKWVDRGILVAFRTPGGHRRVRASDLRAFLVAHQMPVPEELGAGVVKLVAVDAERSALDALRRAFKPHAAGVELTVTTSGMEALLLVSELKPHGLLVDLELKDVEGLELCRKVHGRKALEGVRLITMTASPSSAAVQRSHEAGAVACLGKPVEVAALLELFRVPLSVNRRG